MTTRPEPHPYQPPLFGTACGYPECGLDPDSPVHIDAAGRTPQRRDAGETSRESHEARARSENRRRVWECIVEGARVGDPRCDWDIEHLTGIPWRQSTGARNGLTIDGLVSPIYDPDGKTNPLKRTDKRVLVSNGPWRAKPNPASGGRGRVVVWVPTDGPYGGYQDDSR